ncbi:MAG: ferrochelatase [Gammaproteobacteria bacterium]
MHKQPSDYQHDSIPVTGVLVTNLGSPDAPTPAAVRRYLKEFLWDPRVVEIPRPLWWLILHTLVLTLRPRKSAQAYRKIWVDAGSPLIVNSQRQCAALQELLVKRIKGPVKVVLGMRYGNPSIATALEKLRSANARQIIVLPLYPQHSAATTASTLDAIATTLKDWRRVPDLRFIAQYHDDSGYISALANSIRNFRTAHGSGEQLMFSFHGMPRRTLLAGDPYHCQCQKTARLVAEELDLADDEWIIAFQSRFGREEWLRPYASDTLASLGKAGLQSIDIVCPGFSADCLETLEEMALLNKGVFQQAGGGEYRYIPALNDADEHIESLAHIILQNAAGWPGIAHWDTRSAAEAAQKCAARAVAMGAER